MCFGNDTKKTSETTTKGPEWLTDAGQNNLNFAQNLQTQGFKPYTGQQVADFNPQQQASFGAANNVASSVNGGPIGQLTAGYAGAGAQHVSADPIHSQMSPYMNQYVNMALQPQLAMQDQQFAGQNKGFDAQATGAGAFGDTGWGIGRANLTQQQNTARAGLVGNAYNTAFNTAIGAGAQDVANRMNAGTTNAGLAETALGRQLTGANAMQAQQTGAATLQNQFGGQQTAANQADLNAKYNQWQMAQQYPFQTTQLMNQTLGAAKGVAPTTSTRVDTQPDNSGYGMIGSLVGAGMNMMLPGSGMLMGAMGGMGGGGMGGMPSPSVSPGFQGWTGATGAGGWQNPDYRADGGVLQPGKPTVVGERGPEVIVSNAPGVVIPNEVLEAAREKREKKIAAPALSFGIAA